MSCITKPPSTPWWRRSWNTPARRISASRTSTKTSPPGRSGFAWNHRLLPEALPRGHGAEQEEDRRHRGPTARVRSPAAASGAKGKAGFDGRHVRDRLDAADPRERGGPGGIQARGAAVRNGVGGLGGANGLSTFALAAQGLANRVCAVRRQFISLEIRAGWIHMLRKFRGDWLLALLGFFTERFAKCGRVELRGSPFEDAHRVEGVIVFQPYDEIRFKLGEIRFKVAEPFLAATSIEPTDELGLTWIRPPLREHSVRRSCGRAPALC